MYFALIRTVIILAIFLAWEALVGTGAVNRMLLPPPSEVLSTLHGLVQRADVRANMLITAMEIFSAFILAVPVGFLIAVAIVEHRYTGEVLKPLLFFAFSIPKSVFLPLFILIFGVGFGQKVAFGFFSTVFVVVISTVAALEAVRAEYVTVARSYGATPSQIVWRVYLPSMLPLLLEALRISMIFNVTGIILAEMYASRNGIGSMIANWGENFQMPQLLAGVVLVAAISITFNEVVRWIEVRCSHWRT